MYSVGTYWKYARFQTHYKTYQANSKINLLEILMGNWNIGTYAWSITIHAVVAVTAATEYFDTCAWCMSVYESVCHWICNTKFQNITCARKLSHQTTSHHTDVKYLAMIMNNNSFLFLIAKPLAAHRLNWASNSILEIPHSINFLQTHFTEEPINERWSERETTTTILRKNT